uniref:NADH-ubiquinone oxidoreductase chain 1 n=1 Tax=Paramoeba pemaquidensis TaxID=180228 RepID=A0A1D8D977_9EUKA|nr:NADH dehydrogenase subunit 1 [Paramoeba pemaquidensis]AOS85546.1 NADH dehydrogenase subunit 1 [Paramoeba pemaquidensis]
MNILFLVNLLQYLVIIVPVLLSVAIFTVFERKVIGYTQYRQGPIRVGFLGILQPIADGLKLLIKEPITPINSNFLMFTAAPIITLLLSLINWALVPFNYGVVLSDLNLGILFILGVSSLGVYGVIIAGWSSNSKYAFLGALRSAAQMISYEVSIGIILITVLLPVGSLNLTDIVLAQKDVWFIIPFFPIFLLFFISSVAETNRHPFDLPEAEAELVSGYNVEYSSVGFAFFFIGEYANIIFMSALNTILFMGGWLPPFGFLSFLPGALLFAIKIVFFIFLFIFIRAIFPRYRYDQLMSLGWKVFLPLSLGFFIFYYGLLLSFNIL